MRKVIALMSMSLDGYVADLDDGVAEVFDWYFSGDVEIPIGGSDPMTFRVSRPSADHLHGLISELGAMISGRRTFDKAEGWGGNHAWGPAFVLDLLSPRSRGDFVKSRAQMIAKLAKAFGKIDY